MYATVEANAISRDAAQRRSVEAQEVLVATADTRDVASGAAGPADGSTVDGRGSNRKVSLGLEKTKLNTQLQVNSLCLCTLNSACTVK